MALDTLYSIGTISVGAGSTTVTGVGTAWNTSNTRPGDDFRAAGLTVPIASIDSATQITLARPWPGAAIAAGNYDIRQIDDGARALTAANLMRQSLGSGTLTSLAALTSGANLLPYWSGVGVMATTPLSAAARNLLAGASVAAMRSVLGLGTLDEYTAFIQDLDTRVPINAVSTSRSVVLGDAGKMIEVNSVSPVTITVPDAATEDFPVGSVLQIVAFGTGDVLIAADVGVVIRSPTPARSLPQYGSATLIKRAADDWYLFGDLI